MKDELHLEENVNKEEEEKKEKKKPFILLLKRGKHGKRMLLLVLLLLVTGLMLGTSTYAWFTANKTVNVNNIQVNVAAQNGIQISVDGTSWKSIVQTDDIKGAINKYAAAVNMVPGAIEPVSTVGEVDENGRMKMYYGTVDTNTAGDYILTATKTEETSLDESGKFVVFDLFFKVDADTPVYMTSSSGVTPKDTASDKGIKNASRIGFVVLGNTAAGSTLDAIQGLNAGTSASSYIWEPNYDIHTAAAVTHAKDTYNITTTETNADIIGYSGIKTDITKENNIKVGDATEALNSTYFGTVTPTYKTINGFTEQFSFLTLKSGITKIRVYMWVEGQDVDCENSASGDNIIYNLQITTESTTATGD